MVLRGRKKIILIVVLLLGAGAGILWYGGSSRFLRPRVERAIGEALGVDCAVSGLSVRPLGSARLEEVRIALPGKRDEEPFLRLQNVRVAIGWWQLIRGGQVLREVMVGDLSMRLRPDVVQWAQQALAGDGGSVDMPVLKVKNGTLRAELPALSEPVELSGLRAALSPGEAGFDGSGSFSLAGDRFSVQISSSPAQAETSVRIETAGARVGAFPRPLMGKLGLPEDWRVEGKLVGHVKLRFSSPPHLRDGKISLSQGSISVPGLPVPVEGLNGEVNVSPDLISTAGLSGRWGGARFGLTDARVEIGAAGMGDYQVRGGIRGLDLELLGKGDLAAHSARVLEEVGLRSGRADVKFALSGTAGEGPQLKADIALRAPEARPRIFPVPIRNLWAQIRIESADTVWIREARGRLFGGNVRLGGILTRSPGGEWVPEVQCRFRGVRIGEKMDRDLPREIESVVQQLGLRRGRFRGTVLAGEDDVVVGGRVEQAELRPPTFPYGVEDASAAFRWSAESNRVELRDAVARHSGAVFSARGSVDLADGGPVNLNVEGKGVPLDRELREVLPAGMAPWWETMRPEGRLDLTLRLRDWAPDTEQPVESGNVELEARPRDVSVSLREPELAIHDISGTIRLGGPSLQLEEVSGDVLGFSVEAQGRIPLPGQETPLRVVLRSGRTRLHRELTDGWPEPLRSWAQMLSVAGDVELHGELRGPGVDEMVADGSVGLHGVSATVGSWQVEATGEVDVKVDEIFGANRKTEGRVSLERVTAGPFQASDLVAAGTLSGKRITVQRSDASFYGGKLAVEGASLDLEDLGWSLDMSLSHLDLQSLMAAVGKEGRDAPAGFVRAGLKLSGRGGDRSELSGEAEIQVNRGHLYNLSMILSVLRLLDLSLPRDKPVSRAFAKCELEDEILRVKDVLLSGGTSPIHIRGTVGLKEGLSLAEQPVDLLFTIPRQRSILDSIPVINWIKRLTIDNLRRLVFQARVRGTVGDHQVTTPLRPVTAPFTGMWRLLQKVSPQQVDRYYQPESER